VNATKELRRCVMIAAPHTSNWDFLFAALTFWKHDIKFKFFVKDNYTKSFFFGFLARRLGAIGVDRKNGKNLVEFAIDLLKNNEEMVILVPAEGTRKYVEKWKTGFYHIAKGAILPIALGYLDYENKVAGVGLLMNTTDVMDDDFKRIQDFYENVKGKHPELYNLKIFK
jgi:1-acyl-sn-glycerol-3-phosphate acyltransferase